MTKGTVASSFGRWDMVVKAVNVVFGDIGFTLLAEDAWATEPPHFNSVNSLTDNIRYPRGRAFDREREVRWRAMTGGLYVITYLSENHSPPSGAGLQVDDSEWEIRTGVVQKLYGTWSTTAGDWVEVAVPGIHQQYKGVVNLNPPPKALQMTVVDYSQNGLVQMTRFCAIGDYQENS